MAYLQGWIQGSAAAMQRADVALSVDGKVLHSISLTPNGGYAYNDGYKFSHCRYFDSWLVSSDGKGGALYSTTGDRADMCTSGLIRSDPSTHQTWASYRRFNGKAVYYGKGYDTFRGNTWSYNHTYTYGTGEALGWQVGTEVRLKVSFVDAVGTAVTADQSVVLEDHSDAVNYVYKGAYYESNVGRMIEYWHQSTGKLFRSWKHW